MELSEEQMKVAEAQLRRFLPRSQQVYGYLVLKNRVRSDPVQVFVDRWPEFGVIIFQPQCEQKGDLFKDTVVFAVDEADLKEIISTLFVDWTTYHCLGIGLQYMELLSNAASERQVLCQKLAVCHIMILEDISHLASVDSAGLSLGSLDESHVDLVNRAWKFGEDNAARMIRNMVANFPSCCVLNAERQPVAWILTYASCAMGMLYTKPEYRGRGYAKVLVITLAKRLHAEGLPVYCFIEEENVPSYRLFKKLGFTEDPSHREAWFQIGHS